RPSTPSRTRAVPRAGSSRPAASAQRPSTRCSTRASSCVLLRRPRDNIPPVVLRRRILAKLVLVVGSTLLMVLALEVSLRVWPAMLGVSFANGALSRYTTRAGGIYYADRDLRISFMIPNHSTTMFANGYVWRHRTDALGFRNETLHIPADVMVLGDSFVYGHGVDVEHTVAHYLEQRTGLRVVNLGRQGDCAYQEAYLLTAYLPVFKPRFVVLV